MGKRTPKSLLLVRDYFPPQVGGISMMMESVCERLGDDISCVTAVTGAAAAENRVKVHYLPALFPQGFGRALLALAFVWPRLLAAEQPAVLQFATCEDAYWGPLVQRWWKLPFVIYAHGTEILRAAANSWPRPRQALCAATRVFANSRFTARLLEEKIGVDPARIRILNPGCDTERFTPDVPTAAARRAVGDIGSGPVVVSIGNLVERKGHDLVLRALPDLIKRWPDLTYVVVGDGPFRDRLLELARTLGVDRSVRFVGRVEPALLPSFYRLCDVFAMPSRFLPTHQDVEGFGIVYLEAGACGKPAIGGLSGGTSDAIVHEHTGLLIDPERPENFVQAATRILEDPSFAALLGRNARNRVVADFTWDAFARRVQNEIMEIVPS
jgi:phosphatidylinositol alpha-1,6-mannosyltransferase